MTSIRLDGSRRHGQRVPVVALLLPLLLSLGAPIALAPTADAQESNEVTPSDIWSEDYVNQYFPWGGDDRMQFREYHDYFTMKDRMQYLADRNDVYQASTSSLLAGSIDAERKANIVTGLNGQKKLQLRVDYNRAWVQVRQAIERAEVEILETDRDEAKIVVNFSGIQEEEVKVGFLRNLISRGSEKVDDQRSLQLTVRITDVDDYIEIIPETSDLIDDSLEIDVLFDQFLTVIYDNLS